MRSNRLNAVLAGAAIAISATACGTTDEAAETPTGGVNFSASAQGLSADSVVKVDISCIGYTNTHLLPVTSNDDLATVRARFNGLPEGTCTLDVAAYADSTASGMPEYVGSKEVQIVANGMPAVTIVLHSQTDPDPFTNSAPFIEALILSSTAVAPGTDVYIEAYAFDAEEDAEDLSYEWSSSGGEFDYLDPYYVLWTAPDDGLSPHTITLKVTDSAGASASIDLKINVGAQFATGGASVGFDLELNHGPQIQGITVDQVETFDPDWETRRFHELTVVVSDLENNPTQAIWSADVTCGSFLVTDGSGMPAFVQTVTGNAPVLFDATDADGCNVSVRVEEQRTDGEPVGVGEGTILLYPVDTAIQDVELELFGFFQSRETAGGGQVVTFSVDARGHGASDPLTYATWNTNGQGTISDDEQVWIDPTDHRMGSRLTATWTAPACFSGPAQISVSVDSTGGETWSTYTFVVTGTDTCP